jgi:acetyl esterase/lipase
MTQGLSRRAALVGAAATLSACAAPGPDGTADFTHLNIAAQRDIPYGEHPLQRLDVYPAATPRLGPPPPRRPALVFFHGGFWQFGSRCEAMVETLCSHLAARGITSIAAGYRLYPETNHAGILEDAANAVAWATRHGQEYGAAPDEVVAAGWSAGGWMGAMLQVRPQLVHQALGTTESGRHPLRGFVGVAGPYAHWPTRYPLLFNLFAGTTREERTPNAFVSANLPPALLVQGMLDAIVWPPNAIHFAEDLRQAGNPAQLRRYPLRDHMTVMPGMGILPGSLALVDDIEGFVKGPAMMRA